MILERVFPDQALEKVKGWWFRVILLNIIQYGVVLLGYHSWELYLQKWSLFHLGQVFPPALGALMAYFVVSFVFYFWHRIRHDSNFLWLLCHQIHHSPSRIETITSFYKNPIEIMINSLIISTIVYTLFGFGAEEAALLTLYTAGAEFFYHMNIKTPHFIGYFIQRPEMHRIHHERGKHYNNFADLPIFDIIFGTFENPKTYNGKCGFKNDRENKLLSMLIFKNVNNEYKK